MAALPLSFVPLCLALRLAIRFAVRLPTGPGGGLSGGSVRPGFLTALLAAALVWVTFVATVPKPLADLHRNVYRVAPSWGFLRSLLETGGRYPGGNRLLYDFQDDSLLFMAATMYRRQSSREFMIIGDHNIFELKYDFDRLLEDCVDCVVVSDREYPSLFFGCGPGLDRVPELGSGTESCRWTGRAALRFMDRAWLEENGRVAWSGVDLARGWAVEGDRFSVRVAKPAGMAGSPARLAIRLASAPSNPYDCAPELSMAFLEDGPRVWSDPSPGLAVEAELPPSLTAPRTFRAAVRIAVAPEYGRPGRKARCAYFVEEAELIPVPSGPIRRTTQDTVSPGVVSPASGSPVDGDGDPECR